MTSIQAARDRNAEHRIHSVSIMQKSTRLLIAVAVIFGSLASSGCASIRQISPLTNWDPDDAGYQNGDHGTYVSGGSTAHGWPAATGSIGLIRMPTSWSTLRYGVFGMDDGGVGVGGGEAGVKLHAPTRFSPYAGLSADLGLSGLHSGFVRSSLRHQVGNPTRVSLASGLAAIVPEAGLSYWLTPKVRMNAGASYYIAAGQPDFLLYGLSIEFLFDEESGFDPTTWWPALPDSTRESGSKTRYRVTDRDSRSSFAEYIKTSDLTNPAYDVNGKAIEVEPTAPRHVTWPGIETIAVPPPKTDMPAPLVPQSSFYQVDEM